MHSVIPAPAATLVPVKNSDGVFPVHRIYCIGKNYAAHVVEMGGTPERQPPCFFMKPADAACTTAVVHYPPASTNVHYEGELVIALGQGGRDISPEAALSHVYGYAIGVDMTRRDLQLEAASQGNPWDTGKAFDESAPISAITPVDQCGHFESGSICLSVNGDVRQSADFSELIWKCNEIIAALSRLYTLQAGDLIFTGTPAGVGAVVPGDKVLVEIEGLGNLEFMIIS